MADEPATTPEAAPAPAPAEEAAPKAAEKKPHIGGFLGSVLEKVGLRGLMHQVGGRKMVTGGGALGVISMIIATSMGDVAKAVCCASVAIVAAAVVISIAIEDKGKK